jgi:hypothetical protein
MAIPYIVVVSKLNFGRGWTEIEGVAEVVVVVVVEVLSGGDEVVDFAFVEEEDEDEEELEEAPSEVDLPDELL